MAFNRFIEQMDKQIVKFYILFYIIISLLAF